MTADELVAGIAAGDRRAVARALTLLEREDELAPALDEAVFRAASGTARVVGLTGPPGAGKSTLIDALVNALRTSGRRVAVLAVDPSSPYTGGALLGDRVRMREHDDDGGLFFRSIASRGQLGGLAPVVRAAIRVLDAAGYELILVETVGVGQSEIEVARVADCGVIVAVPGAGDGIQLMKAGLLESGDVYAINKCDEDEPATIRLRRDLRAALGHGRDGGDPPAVQLVSARVGTGVAELIAAIDAFLVAAAASGRLETRRRADLEREVLGHVERQAVATVLGDAAVYRAAVDAAMAREADPATVARRLLELMPASR